MEETQSYCSSLKEEISQFVEICSDEAEKLNKFLELLKKWSWTRKVLVLVNTSNIAEYLLERILHHFGVQVKDYCYVIHGAKDQEERANIKELFSTAEIHSPNLLISTFICCRGFSTTSGNVIFYNIPSNWEDIVFSSKKAKESVHSFVSSQTEGKLSPVLLTALNQLHSEIPKELSDIVMRFKENKPKRDLSHTLMDIENLDEPKVDNQRKRLKKMLLDEDEDEVLISGPSNVMNENGFQLNEEPPYTSELEFNEYGQYARWVTIKNIDSVQAKAGVSITIQGRYIPSNTLSTDRKLYFQIVGTAACVQMAKSMLRATLTEAEERIKLMEKRREKKN